MFTHRTEFAFVFAIGSLVLAGAGASCSAGSNGFVAGIGDGGFADATTPGADGGATASDDAGSENGKRSVVCEDGTPISTDLANREAAALPPPPPELHATTTP